MHRKLLNHTTILCGLALLPAVAYANPQGGTVVGGSATISSAGNTLTVQQTTDRAIIDWSSFDIGASETTQFQQPSSNSITLNRIRNSKPSQIQGQLTANGNIILMNPNGVVFTGTSQVNVNSLIATASDTDNTAFMNGGNIRFNISGRPEAKIIAQGNITVASAGLVGLVAPGVENQGTITATLGKVQLASGDGFTLDLAGDGISEIVITSALAEQIVKNSGLINAAGGRIELTAAAARSMVDALVVNTGALKADSVSSSGGVIRLTATGGKLRNSGTVQAKGGSVDIAADEVEQHGTIDVSGDAGGSVNIAFASRYSDNGASSILANGASGEGGHIHVIGTDDSGILEASGTYRADSEVSDGGEIEFYAEHIAIRNGRVSVRGRVNGGRIVVGHDPVSGRRARDILVDEDTTLIADGETGHGGSIEFKADSIDMRGLASAQGVLYGGTINIDFGTLYDSADTTELNVSSAGGQGGTIHIEGDDSNAALYAKGAYIATGETGGEINMLAGRDVMLLGALLNTSGTNGGGMVRVGGDYQGAAGTRRSRYTEFDANSRIYADATDNGDGGTVILWSDDHTVFKGEISAKGGANGGDGGLVETSGKKTFELGGRVYANAPHGEGGTWLLDPADITINGSATTAGGAPDYTPLGTASIVNVTDIVNALNAGTNVTITTGGDVYAGSGNITLASAISATTGTGGVTGSLTLSAYGNIIINTSSAITLGASGTVTGGTVTLQSRNSGAATGYISVASAITTYGGDIIMGGSADVTTGYAVGEAIAGNTRNGIYITANLNAAGGSIKLRGQGGTYSSGGNVGIVSTGSLTTSGTGLIGLNAIGGTGGSGNANTAITLSNNITHTGSGNITVTTSVENASTSGFQVSGIRTVGGASYSGIISISGSGHVNASLTTFQTSTKAITMNSSGGGIYTGDITTTSAAVTLTGDAIYTGNITTSSSGSAAVILTSTSDISTGTITGSSVTARADSDNNETGYIKVGNITTNNGAVILGGGADASLDSAVGNSSNTTQYGVQTGSISASGGSITINGKGGTYSSGSNYGVQNSGAITTSGSGQITINGEGGSGGNSNSGVYVNHNITSTGSGTISINGIGGSGSSNVSIAVIGARTIGGGSFTGSLVLGVTYGVTAGSATFQTSGTAITMNASTSGNLALGTVTASSAAINLTAASGYVTVAALNNSGAAINVTSSTSYIYASGAITNATTAGSTVSLTAADSITTTGITGYGITLRADSDNNEVGYIYNTGTLVGNAGGIILGGGADASTDYAVGSSSNGYQYGVYVSGTITTGGGSLLVNGLGGTYSSGTNYGIYFASNFVSGAGAVTLNGTGGSAGNSNYGIWTASIARTGSGAVLLNGTAGSGSSNAAILINSNATIGSGSFTGTVTLTGTSGYITGSNLTISTGSAAVTISASGNVQVGSITTSSAAVSMTSTSGYVYAGTITTSTTSGSTVSLTAASYIYNTGITGYGITARADSDNNETGYINIGGAIVGNAGGIILGGGADASTDYAVGDSSNTTQYGVYVSGSITTGGGSLLVNGKGGAYASGTNYGVYLASNFVSGAGAVTLNGTGGSAGNSNYGIYMASMARTGSGAVLINGTAGSGSSNAAIAFIGTNTVGSGTFTGTITLTGTSGYITGSSLALTTTTAAINVSASGNIIAGALSTTSAAINVTSTGGYISMTSATTSTTSGSTIALTATDYIYLSSTSTAYGITMRADSDNNETGYIYLGGTITGNAGGIVLGGGADATTDSAVGSNNSGTQYGVYTAAISSSGNVTINGLGGAYTSGTNYGVYIATAGTITSTGNVSITGVGGSSSNSNYGVYFGASLNHTGSGTVTVRGKGGSGTTNYGVAMASSTTLGGASASGDLTIAASSLNMGGTNVVRTTGNITIKGYESGTTIGFGDSSASSNINLSNTYIGFLNWGSAATLYIGDSTNTAAIDVTYATTLTKKVAFISSTNITLSGNMTSSVAGDAIVFAAAGNFVNSGSKTVTLNNAGTKRWIIYSANAADSTAGGLSPAQTIYGQTYGTLAPSSIVAATYSASQNTWVYANGGGTITFTALAQSIEYGSTLNLTSVLDTNFSFACSTGCSYADAVASGTLSLSSSVNGTSNAATYTGGITAAVGTLTFNGAYASYTISYVAGNATVTPANLTITASAGSKTYGDTLTFAGTEFTHTALKNSETIGSVTLTSAGAAASANVNTYNITPSAATGGTFTASNYNITYATGTLTVGQKNITITASNQNKTYGSVSLGTSSYTVNTALANSDAISGVTLSAVDINTLGTSGSGNYNVGTWGITPSAAVFGTGSASNYNITYATTGRLTIAQKALTISATGTNRGYDGSTDATVTLGDDRITNDVFTSAYTSAVFAVDGNVANGKTVNVSGISISGADSGNYSYNSTASTTANITPYAITIRASDQSKTYGSVSLGTSSYSIISGSLQGSDALSGVTLSAVDINSLSTSTSGNYNVGTWGITPSAAAFSSGSSSNYTITYSTVGRLTIGQKALSITAVGVNRDYNGGTGATATLSDDRITNDVFTTNYSAAFATDGNVGNGKTVNVSSISISGGDSANYSYNTTASTTANITPYAITIKANNQSQSYGSVSLGTSAYSLTVGTLQGSDAISGVTLSAVDTNTLGTSGSGNGNVGTWGITPSAAAFSTGSSGNYTITYDTTGTLTIGQKALTLTADSKSRYYGSNNPSLTYALSGLVSGDTEGGVLSGVGVTTGATSSSNVGTYTLTMAGTLTSSNYSLTLQNGTLTVNQAVLTVTPGNKTRIYGVANPTLDGTITGFVLGHTEAAIVASSPTYATAANSGSAVGTYNITSSGGSLNSANYVFAYGTGTLTVNPATIALTITASDRAKTYGDAITFSGTEFSTVGLSGGDSITGVTLTSSGAAATANVGTYSIIASAATGTGLSNYTITYMPGTLTVNKASLSVYGTDKTKRQFDALPTLGVTMVGLKSWDDSSAFTGYSVSTAATGMSGQGHYAINVSGGTSANYTITYIAGRLTVEAPLIPAAIINLPPVNDNTPIPVPTNTNDNDIGSSTSGGSYVFTLPGYCGVDGDARSGRCLQGGAYGAVKVRAE